MRRTLFGGERRGNPFENPAIPLTDAGLLNFFGGAPTDAGVNMNEEISLRLSAVFRCATLLSGVVGGLPLKVYNKADKGEVVVPCLEAPAGAVNTPIELWETVMMHVLLWGNGYLHKVRNGLGKIVELRIIHPSRVKPDVVVIDADDPMTGKVFQVQSKSDGQWRPYTDYDILHLMGPSTDGVRGLSRVALARESLAIGLAADKLAAQLFGNGNLMSGVLQVKRTLTKDAADQLKAGWRAKMQGIKHAHDVAVLDADTTFQPLTLPPEDVQFLQSRQWQVNEIARWFGVPPHLVGDITKSTTWGTGLEQQNMGLLKYTIQPYLTRIEQRVTREILDSTSQYAEFLVDSLLRPDMMQRYQAYNLGIMSGWITRNEVRRKENLPPLPGLDEPLVPTLAPPATGPATPIGDEPASDAADGDDVDPLDDDLGDAA